MISYDVKLCTDHRIKLLENYVYLWDYGTIFGIIERYLVFFYFSVFIVEMHLVLNNPKDIHNFPITNDLHIALRHRLSFTYQTNLNNSRTK